jgi:hypothetical protein
MDAGVVYPRRPGARRQAVSPPPMPCIQMDVDHDADDGWEELEL